MFIVGILILIISFWWPTTLGFLSIIGCVWCLYKPAQSWWEGVCGTIMLWASHLYWVPTFITTYITYSWVGTTRAMVLLSLYLLAVFILLWWGLWRAIQHYLPLLHKQSISRSISVLVLIFSVQYSLPFLTCSSGMPFLNPLLPLVVWSKDYFSSQLPDQQWIALSINKTCCGIYYLPKIVSGCRLTTGQQIYKALCRVPPSPKNTVRNYIISCESLFPYSLHEMSDEISMWRSGLPINTDFIWGGTYGETTKRQAVFSINKSLITALFIKKHGVDFFEIMPQTELQKFIGDLCLFVDSDFVVDGKSNSYLLDDWEIIVCSDLLLPLMEGRKPLLCLMNEEWLPEWLQELWQGIGLLTGLKSGRKLVLAGCNNARMLIFKDR